MRCLVIGGAGFIGRRVVEQLAQQGHEVSVYLRGQTAANLPAGVQRIFGDRRQLGEHVEEFRRIAPDVVVDMIAFTEQDARSLVSTFCGIAARLVVVSSGDVYRAFGLVAGIEQGALEEVPITEEASLRTALYLGRAMGAQPGDDLYDYEKILVEQVVIDQSSLPATILRLPMVYGPGDKQHRLYPYLRRMDDQRPVIPLDVGMAGWRCLRGYVDDVAGAIACAATHAQAAGRVYNVAEPRAYAESEWIGMIAKIVGWNGRVVTVPKGRLTVPFHVAQDLVVDTTRIRAELGYAERTHADDALRQTIAWERHHPPAETAVDYSLEDAVLDSI
jgi:nucleoside-diphosphate-sugar epimerase